MDISTVAIAALIVVVSIVALKVGLLARKAKTHDTECRRLLEAAKVTLSSAKLSHLDYAWRLEELHGAYHRRDSLLLGAYVRLIGQQDGYLIAMAVMMVERMLEQNPSGMNVDTLTADQVRVYDEVRTMLGKGTDADLIAYYTMNNMDDYELIVSIAQRGVMTLDEVELMLIEMKLNQADSLAEGVL